MAIKPKVEMNYSKKKKKKKEKRKKRTNILSNIAGGILYPFRNRCLTCGL